MVAISAPPSGSRNVDKGGISEAEGLRGGGQLLADNRLLCGPLLIKIKWQAGGESVLLPDDIDSWYVSQSPNDSTTDASRNSRQEQS